MSLLTSLCVSETYSPLLKFGAVQLLPKIWQQMGKRILFLFFPVNNNICVKGFITYVKDVL